MLRTVVFLFFLGAFLGTLGDFCHVISQTDGYLSPLLPLPGGQPIWVPFLFAGAALGIGLTHYWADGWLRSKRPDPMPLKKVIIGGVLFELMYGISGFLPLQPEWIRNGILFGAAALVWIFLERTWQGLLLAIGTAITGTAVEYTLTQVGAFYYGPGVANSVGVPTWLPSLYIIASVVGGNFGRYLMGLFYRPALKLP